MADEDKLFCPQCKEWFPKTHFTCLPLDLRCNKCIPGEVAAVLYDQKVEKAGQVMSKIFDQNPANASLRPLERMINGAYDAWGGPGAFCNDVVKWMKDLGDTPRGKSAAVSAAMKLMALHAKVDRMRLEDDWKQMDDQTLRDTLKVKMMALMAEAQTEDAKKIAKNKLIGHDE